MYNWSIDEKKFKNIKEVTDFLKKQPEILRIKLLREDKNGTIIKIKLRSSIHPVREFLIAKILQDKCSQLKISVV